MTTIKPFRADGSKTERFEATVRLPDVGQWFWVAEEDSKWLGCVVLVGSNFVKLCGPYSGSSSYQARIHFNNVESSLTFVPDCKSVLAQHIRKAQDKVSSLMAEVQALTESLGISPLQRVEHLKDASGTALATMANAVDIDGYKQSLNLANKETIPKLKDSLRKATEVLVAWLKAETIPLLAMAEQSTEVSSAITDRVFSLELYAGLVETAVQFATGTPPAVDEKLRVFQRMLFCDEEALLAYDDGGMDIKNIGAFQDWLSRPENRDRLLPFGRCLLAMRVRRSIKARDSGGSIFRLFDNAGLSESDKWTYLFVRNGENLYRISTAIEFDELIFPDRTSFDPSEPMMIKMFAGRVDKMIPRRTYDSLSAEHALKVAEKNKWIADNPIDAWKANNPNKSYSFAIPHEYSGSDFRPSDWAPFDNTNVYFDEALAKVGDEIKKYNRVAIIIQGIFDRSTCLAPHLPVRSWTPQGFAQAIELIYDGATLTFGDPPCFEDYMAQCNAKIDVDSVLIGQEKAWLEREAEIENRRISNSWRSTPETYRPKQFKPYGDEGPGYLARPSKVQKRAGRAVFHWFRKARTRSYEELPPVRATITVSFDYLFNVSAYKQGDYKQFFRDPRTREQYLKWAPMLLAAEDYCLKGTSVQMPSEC
jgi:hypothetical protein